MAASAPGKVSAFAVSTSLRWRSTCAVRNGLSSCCERRGSRASSDGANSHRMPPPDVRRIGIDLNDGRAIRIELTPSEIRAKHQQKIKVKDGVIATRAADDAGHPDVVWIVVLDEVLAPRRVRHWRVQPR